MMGVIERRSRTSMSLRDFPSLFVFIKKLSLTELVHKKRNASL